MLRQQRDSLSSVRCAGHRRSGAPVRRSCLSRRPPRRLASRPVSFECVHARSGPAFSWNAAKLLQKPKTIGFLDPEPAFFIRSADDPVIAILTGLFARRRRQETLRQGLVDELDHLREVFASFFRDGNFVHFVAGPLRAVEEAGCVLPVFPTTLCRLPP